MLSLEALILFDMLAAHHNTLARVVALAPDYDSEGAVAARFGHLVAYRDLVKALHEFAPGARLRLRDGRGVAADSEGGLHWRRGPRRVLGPNPFSRS